MFIAYEATSIVPENLLDLKAKIGPKAVDKWEELLNTRVNQREHFYIIFNIVTNETDSNLGHIVVPAEFIEKNYNVSNYDGTIFWITKKD